MSKIEVQLEGHANLVEVDDDGKVISSHRMDDDLVCAALVYVLEQGLKYFIQNEKETEAEEAK